MDATALPSDPPPVPAAPAKSSAWPLVFGIFGLIFGIGAILSSLSGLGMVIFRGPFVRMTSPMNEAEMMVFYDRHMLFMFSSSIVAFLLGGLLVLGSIGLLRRRRRAVPILRTWAAGKLLYAAIIPIWTLPIQRESFAIQKEAMTHSTGTGSSPPGMDTMFNLFDSLGPLLIALQVGWLAVLPVIFLILFAMPKIRQETRTWS